MESGRHLLNVDGVFYIHIFVVEETILTPGHRQDDLKDVFIHVTISWPLLILRRRCIKFLLHVLLFMVVLLVVSLWVCA